MPDTKSAILYSLNAMTSYGHANLHLAPRWEMMGALEALNGWILFGLTTAFLFTVIQKAWPLTYQKQKGTGRQDLEPRQVIDRFK